MSQIDEQDELKTFTRGEYIFHEGERGGDLYIIEKGEVEVLHQHQGQEVLLSEMKAGEILGVMTCLTDEPRMASARAKTGVKARRIAHGKIKDQMSKIPQWLNVVLKEYSIRLTQMNQSFSKTAVKVKALEKSQLSAVYTAIQMTSAMPALAKYVTRKIGDEMFVAMDDMFTVLELTLCQPKIELDKIFNALLASGLAKVEINPDTKKIALSAASLKSILGFHQFLNDVQAGKMKRLTRMKMSNKDSRVLMALCKLAKSLYANAKEPCQLSSDTIKEYFKKKAGMELDLAVLEVAKENKLIKIDGAGEESSVTLVPARLEGMVRCLEAYRRIRLLDERYDSDQLAV